MKCKRCGRETNNYVHSSNWAGAICFNPKQCDAHRNNKELKKLEDKA